MCGLIKYNSGKGIFNSPLPYLPELIEYFGVFLYLGVVHYTNETIHSNNINFFGDCILQTKSEGHTYAKARLFK